MSLQEESAFGWRYFWFAHTSGGLWQKQLLLSLPLFPREFLFAEIWMALDQGLPVARATRTDLRLVLDGLAFTCEGHEKDVSLGTLVSELGNWHARIFLPLAFYSFFPFPFFLFLEENAVGPHTESHKDDADSDDT